MKHRRYAAKLFWMKTGVEDECSMHRTLLTGRELKAKTVCSVKVDPFSSMGYSLQKILAQICFQGQSNIPQMLVPPWSSTLRRARLLHDRRRNPCTRNCRQSQRHKHKMIHNDTIEQCNKERAHTCDNRHVHAQLRPLLLVVSYQ